MAENASKNGEVLILAHRKELLRQHIDLMQKLNIDTDNIRIESVFTEVKRLKDIKPALIIVDEAHLSMAKSWQKVLQHYDTYTVGFSATPCRLDGKPLGDLFASMVESVSVDWLIENSNLAPFEYYAPPTEIDFDTCKTARGDYIVADAEEVLSGTNIYSDFVTSYTKIAPQEKTIVYCISKKHSQVVAQEFIDAGYKAEVIDSDTANRSSVYDNFKDGDTEILINCGIISEGVSIDNCSCVMLLRPTQSFALFIQQSMRCMRYLPNKTAKIIDCVGNYQRHGLPNQKRKWSLFEPQEKRSQTTKEGHLLIRTCQTCYKAFKYPMSHCPFCGAEYETNSRELKIKAEIQLQLIKQQELEENKKRIEEEKRLKKIELHKCKTVEDLYNYAKKYGYKEGWVHYRSQYLPRKY